MGVTHTTPSWIDMSITTFPTAPKFTYTNSSSLSHTAAVYSGVSFQTREACNLTGAMIASSYLTGTTAVYKFELWPLSTTALNTPDTSGSVLATSANIQPNAHFGIWDADFTVAYTATAGQFLCVIIKPVSGVDGSNKVQFNYLGGAMERHAFPSGMKSTDSGSSWVADSFAYPGIAVKTNKTQNLGGIPNMGTSSVNMSVLGDRVAQKITIPADEDSDTGLEVHCSGFYYTGNCTTNGETINFGAWDVDGNDLVTPVTLDHEQLGDKLEYDTGAEFYFGEDLRMISGGSYYIGWESTSTDTTQISCFRYGKTGAGYSLTPTPGNPERNWPGDAAMNIETFFWDDSDAETAWEIPPAHVSYGGSRMCLNPLLSEIHGVSNVVPNTTKGKGDLSKEKAPSRENRVGYPGYQVNSFKTITRANGNYGWSPF